MTKNGTDENDNFHFKPFIERINGRRGDDVFWDWKGQNFKVDGGFGFDTFNFEWNDGEDVRFHYHGDDRVVVKVYDSETHERLQKFVLIDVEEINPYMHLY